MQAGVAASGDDHVAIVERIGQSEPEPPSLEPPGSYDGPRASYINGATFLPIRTDWFGVQQ
jgi:hypothetical protein